MDLTEVIESNKKIIYKIITRFRNYVDIDDLYQVAIIGLMKAYKSYDDSYNVKFMSYAYPFILGEVFGYVRESKNIKINRKYFSLYKRINTASELLSQRLMRNPTYKEVANFLEIDEELVMNTVMISMDVKSLDNSIRNDETLSYYDLLEENNDSSKYFDLYYELGNLEELEKKIIYLKYFEDFSQKEIGDKLGMYQVDVSRKERKILCKLRDNMMV